MLVFSAQTWSSQNVQLARSDVGSDTAKLCKGGYRTKIMLTQIDGFGLDHAEESIDRRDKSHNEKNKSVENGK